MLAPRDAGRLFSSKRIREIAEGDFDFLFQVCAWLGNKLPQEFSVQDALDCAYQRLSYEYRGEYFYKNSLVKKILLGKHSCNTATIIPEFRVGTSKADCVLVNGASTCFEVKSEYDNLDRLRDQLEDYRKVFEKVYVVCAPIHTPKLLGSQLGGVGVYEVTARQTLRLVREAEAIKGPLDVTVLMRSLRAKEYRDLVALTVGSVPEVLNTEIFDACEQLLKTASSEAVRKNLCVVLKRHRAVSELLMRELPDSLLMAGICFKLSVAERRSLIQNLSLQFSKDAICTTRS